MKITSSLAVLCAAAVTAKGQGTFLYDQQSATNGIGTFFVSITEAQPLGQAFTPSLSAVGFVQLQLFNAFTPTNATIAVNLWADSLGGTLLGTTEPLSLPARFGTANTNFLFASPVAVTPGNTYYLQPVIQSGGNSDWFLRVDFYNYSGGALFMQGQPRTDGQVAWFREGIIVPEPSTMLLFGLGLGVLFGAWRVRIRRSLLP